MKHKDLQCLDTGLEPLDFPGLSAESPKLSEDDMSMGHFYFRLIEDLEPETLPKGKIFLKNITASGRKDGRLFIPKDFFEHVRATHAFPLGRKFLAWFKEGLSTRVLPIGWQAQAAFIPLHAMVGQIPGDTQTGNDYYALEIDLTSWSEEQAVGNSFFTFWISIPRYDDDSFVEGDIAFIPFSERRALYVLYLVPDEPIL